MNHLRKLISRLVANSVLIIMATGSIGPKRTMKLIARRLILPEAGTDKPTRFALKAPGAQVRLLNERIFDGFLLREVLKQSALNLLIVHNLGSGGGADKFVVAVAKAVGNFKDVNVFIVGEKTHASLRQGSALSLSPSTLSSSDTVELISKLVALKNTTIILGNTGSGFTQELLDVISGHIRSKNCGIISFCEDRDLFGIDRSSGMTAMETFARAGLKPGFMVSDNLRRLEFLERKFNIDVPKFTFAVPAGVEVQNFVPSQNGPIAVVGRNVKQKQIANAVKCALAANSDVVVVTDVFDLKDPRVTVVTGGTMEDALMLRPSMFLHASLYDGTANTLIEAASHGIPIVAFSGSTSEEISSIYSGFTLFHSHKASAVLNAIHETLASYPERLRLAQASKESVRQHFSQENLQIQIGQFLTFLKGREI